MLAPTSVHRALTALETLLPPQSAGVAATLRELASARPCRVLRIYVWILMVPNLCPGLSVMTTLSCSLFPCAATVIGEFFALRPAGTGPPKRDLESALKLLAGNLA